MSARSPRSPSSAAQITRNARYATTANPLHPATGVYQWKSSSAQQTPATPAPAASCAASRDTPRIRRGVAGRVAITRSVALHAGTGPGDDRGRTEVHGERQDEQGKAGRHQRRRTEGRRVAVLQCDERGNGVSAGLQQVPVDGEQRRDDQVNDDG